jgi:hypothetical protein
MIYFANPSNPAVRAAMLTHPLGAIMTHAQHNLLPPDVVWVADNGCGPGKRGVGHGFPGYEPYWAWLAGLIDREDADPCDPDTTGCLFAVAPDVVGDADATLARQQMMRSLDAIRLLGLPAAFVLQDGQERRDVPWEDCDAVFIGGSTEWKLGPHARALAARAAELGKWVHMGRVSSLKRLRYAQQIGCRSADGTFISFAPDRRLPEVLGWLHLVNSQGSLW